MADRPTVDDPGISEETPDPAPLDTNLFAFFGACLGFFCLFVSHWSIVPIATLVTSGVGLSKAEKQGGKGLAIAGLVLGVIGIIIWAIQHGHINN